jgi:plasmid stabilization system protein ParE
VASVVVTPTARADLARLMRSHSLPSATVARVKRSIEPLATFPELGGQLEGRWARLRFVLGPWRWMIIVYHFDPATDRVSIVTIQDGRSADAPRVDRV